MLKPLHHLKLIVKQERILFDISPNSSSQCNDHIEYESELLCFYVEHIFEYIDDKRAR